MHKIGNDWRKFISLMIRFNATKDAKTAEFYSWWTNIGLEIDLFVLSISVDWSKEKDGGKRNQEVLSYIEIYVKQNLSL